MLVISLKLFRKMKHVKAFFWHLSSLMTPFLIITTKQRVKRKYRHQRDYLLITAELFQKYFDK